MKNIIRIITMLLILIIIFSMAASVAINDDKDVLIIAGDKNYPPYEFIDDDGEYRGFNVDLMRALAIELGVEIKLVPMDWMGAHAALINGKIDAIQGMSFNENRAEIYDFSNEYLVNSQVCFVKKDNSIIFGLEDLKGRRVAVQRSDFAAYTLAEIGEIEVVFFSDLDEAFSKLINNDVDAVVGNRLTGLYNIQKKRIEDKIKIVGYELNQTPYGIAFKKGNQQLVKEANIGLENLKKNGTYQKIYEKWFGKEIKPEWKSLKYTLYFLSFIILLTMLIILFITRLNLVLKREVEKRTHELEMINKELEAKQLMINESNRFKEQVLDSLGNGLITFDKDGTITTINKNSESLIGIKKIGALGRKYNEIGLDEYFDMEKLKDCITFGTVYSLEEKTFYHNHRNITFSYTLSPLKGDEDVHIGAVLTYRDITEVIMLRNKLAEKDKMQSLGRLVAGIAHEIRNPLTSIKTYIELMPIKYDNKDFREKMTQQVPAEITRLNSLLSDLIDYSKPKKMKKEAFYLKDIIVQTVELFTAELDKKGIILKYNIEDNVNIYADKQQIRQIIINLLINSIESIEESGEISFSIKQDEDKIIMEIVDNGKGISEEDMDNLFEPFFTTKADGTGLGLSICYQYVKENNGQINIRSKENIGTTIELVFKNNFEEDAEEGGYNEQDFDN